ncbi:MAG TPA: histidine kinase dimerization/phosphoacceptor domain -containing protein [Spirochaetota bacterium]|nr:histidine kinase dimerization/phosphoacceptor domain -containing protein [Spirochaetota bacterium]HSA16461.1 histidine kinase dimerization/phosphoacceptor domain -containing protein [Spirochaetota bacterium]
MRVTTEGLLKRYRDYDHITRLRARFFLGACIAVVFIMPPIIAYNIYLSLNREVYGYAIYWPIIAPLVFIFFIYIIVAFLIATGRFSIGAHIFFIASQLLIWSIIIVDKSGPLERLDTIVVVIAILSMSPLVITRRAWLIPAYSAVTVLANILIVKFLIPGLTHTETVDYLGDVGIAAVVAAIFSYNLFSISRTALDQSEESRKNLERANEELAATNEELESTNEELTATNEEYEAQNEELIKSQEVIRESLEEKNVLIKEVHHRVKNNMQIISSLLNMQSENVDDSLIKKPLNDAVSRIRSIALIHEKLYKAENFSRIDMSTYIADLLEENILLCSRPDQEIQVSTKLEPITLSINQAVPCGILINEIITNSIKHGCVDETGCRIVVEMHALDNMATITISDSGPGLEHDIQDYSGANTMGIQLINALVSQLNAEISVSAENGTTFTIRFNIIN